MFTESQIQALAPKPDAFTAGKKLSAVSQWVTYGKSDRAMWGEIKGSGSTPYKTEIDIEDIAYKCSCPSRQFPCKHGLGLLLLFSDASRVSNAATDEPDWVKEWIDKRRVKVDKPKEEEKEYTEEEKLKLDKAKEKRQDNRIELVNGGIQELDTWLQDIVRLGFLELPTRPRGDFQNMAARMVDSKAPGLAGWIRSLGELHYDQSNDWLDSASDIVGKLYLLIQAWKNFDNLTPIWQSTLKNLFGWTQSSKELLADGNAPSLKDEWIVIGQEVEDLDDIVVQRNWLWGCKSNRCALILNFGTRFSPLENTITPGIIMEAELLFFPSVLEQRAIVKMQKGILPQYSTMPYFIASFDDLLDVQASLQAINPWLNNQAYLLENITLVKIEEQWYLCDATQKLLRCHYTLNNDVFLKWILMTDYQPTKVALVIKGNTLLPLGLFQGEKYTTL